MSMDEARGLPKLSAQRYSSTISRVAVTALRASWPSLLLGVATRALLYGIAAVFDRAHSDEAFVGELLSRLSWSLILCIGLAVALVATKKRALTMGAAGFIAAPLAFFVSQGLRRGAVTFLRLIQLSGAPSPAIVALVKGLEYACLGVILGEMGQRRRGRRTHYGLIGGAIGLGFGGVILFLTATSASAPMGTSVVLSWAVNEVFFPIGCALVIFYGERRPR
jgi:hypothetical protein